MGKENKIDVEVKNKEIKKIRRKLREKKVKKEGKR